ncbi:Oxaloacetate decarboxylase, gamma chain [Clostridium amylolyticum]|uniref:Oxaloacetate decarboxylase, gamma chain n=1 Tax=Clostridium amylolyticum TaxID=1121298 RepID=A0A1M6LGE9_9CLOT|nr:OadG family transporter subunit [Clostridium amylolyticum]SHJ70304.1 Oxaloacetate decarboxylase, gamma chain [Clostridium amylolyticum]
MKILQEGLAVTLFAMAIVFMVLTVLLLLIKLQTYIFSKIEEVNKKQEHHEKAIEITNNMGLEKNKDAAIETQKNVQKDIYNNEEIVAAIMAALSIYTEDDKVQFKIRSIRRVEEDTNWAKANLL